MIRLERYEFACPFCGEEKVTFITREKLEDVRRREKPIEEIFDPQFFPSTYYEIFVSKICYSCQSNTFGNNKEPFDVNIGDNTDELEARISEMYENAR